MTNEEEVELLHRKCAEAQPGEFQDEERKLYLRTALSMARAERDLEWRAAWFAFANGDGQTAFRTLLDAK